MTGHRVNRLLCRQLKQNKPKVFEIETIRIVKFILGYYAIEVMF